MKPVYLNRYAKLGLRENIYGHVGRLAFLEKHIRRSDKVLEFGCGTGVMITIPLKQLGYNIVGLDLDKPSIAYGRNISKLHGIPETTLICADLEEIGEHFDVIVASEVFEHIPDMAIDKVLSLIHGRLKPGGTLIITVPNGFGWYELESFVWKRLGLGFILDRTKIASAICRIKQLFIGKYIDSIYLSSLDESPHVQRFTFGSIRKLLEKHNFRTIDQTGTVLLSGQLSNLLFTGISPIMWFNKILGKFLPIFASGFMVVCKRE